MKQTIFNASLEESMNLVTDKYIQTSMENVKEHGVWKKIIGTLTLLFMMYLFSFITRLDSLSSNTFLSFKTSFITKMIVFNAVFVAFIYFIYIFKNINFRYRQYSIYGSFLSIMSLIFLLEAFIILVSLATTTLGWWIGTFGYTVIFIFVLVSRFKWLIFFIKGKLYGASHKENKAFKLLETFSQVSQKYGPILLFLIFILRWFFPSNMMQENDFVRFIIVSFSPLGIFIPLYFTISMLAEHFQGYYLKKYSEDYRQMSGYSIEEWYGKKSKMYS
ncbi:hypothetical protein [Streptococcus thoraltensis]|uniref:hypothetical protein n=1 Tax=Streptococcus thoraltensis TaxID=55085 RepID=UPI0003633971|nr:hypothetical protein [Streptococcus thoraltensis]